MSNLVLYAIPVFIISVVLEALWARHHPEIKGYELRDSTASMTLGLVNVIVNGLIKLVPIPLFAVLYEHRVVDLGGAWWSWIVLLFAEDVCYYWFHRVHHEVRLLWACHVNHHSSRYFNLSTALRQPLLTPLTGPVFWAPLPLIGFPPWMVLTAQAWSLLYQFWIHTELVDRLGPLEWFMNTPSHHRVHHAKNVGYLDKNHGGIFILWDRWFGTFAPETERAVYGLTKDIQSFRPLRIAFHEFAAIGRDLHHAPTLGAKLGYVFAPPGWSHDGSSLTATQLQRGPRAPGGR
ncbi:MAG TPA: sterol desaturase family protein [Kofleriaceae bacterium]|nr:sterol desaturase family protein [Kofleriaceae bacterium]